MRKCAVPLAVERSERVAAILAPHLDEGGGLNSDTLRVGTGLFLSLLINRHKKVSVGGGHHDP